MIDDYTKPPRIINLDGTVNIHCRICGKFICTWASYRGWSSAECSECATGVKPEPVQNPALIPPPPLTEAGRDRAGEPGFIFKAIGFARRKITELTTPSSRAGAERVRRPLFDSKMEE